MSLWGEEFDSPSESINKKLINKINNPIDAEKTVVKKVTSKKIPLDEKLKIIYGEVDRVLGKYKDDTIVIRDKDELKKYFDEAIKNGEIAIDTETNNSLDPLTCLLMGPCIYTPNQKNCYIPMHHTDLYGNLLDNQLTEKDFKEQLDRLGDTKVYVHNGKFDYQVIKCTCGYRLKMYWDSMIAARILNENEKSAGLKQQYIDKIDSSQEKYNIEKLFEGIPYNYVDPNVFALYSATDPYMTYRLAKWQEKQFDNPDNKRLLNLFMTIEMPIVTVAAEMELTGVCIDFEYANRLSKKYHKKLDDVDIRIAEELKKYEELISKWRLTPNANKKVSGEKVKKSKNEQLMDPPQVSSPLQLSILLYDVLGLKHNLSKEPERGTGEAVLKSLNNPLCNLILEKRGLEKLISTYIDKLPVCVNEKDRRLHAHFNQLGTDTGRFSSNEPNLQNIPSHDNSIRMIFTASPGYVMVGSDFSQQEPRLLAHYSGDKNMINAYKEGKDLYAMIASKVYHNNYEDNKEFRPDGTMNPDGKKRRTSVKSLLLGR